MASQTANQVLTRAFRRIKVLGGEETMTAAELADGLVTLNGAMHGFNAKGIHYVHSDLASADTVNMPDEMIDSLIWMIADSLASEYAYEFTPREQGSIIDARNMLQAAYWVQPPADTEPSLRPLPARFNITTGE